MSEWQPIETAPRDEAPVLVATTEGHVGEAVFHHDGAWWWANSYGEYWAEEIEIRGGRVTHWMPMPEPPNE